MENAVIVSAARTPVGTMGGAFVDVPAPTLGAIAAQEAMRRAGLDAVDEVLMGNVLSAGLGQNPARQAALGAGLAVSTPSMTVNKVCGSGLKTIALAAQAIRAGDAEVVLAGGMENMSRAPYLVESGRFGYRLGHGELVDEMIRDGLWCAFEDCHMGTTAENVAKEYEVSREDQDAFAAASQQKAETAMSQGRFRSEIIGVPVKKRKEIVTVDVDEHPRAGITVEALAAMRPAFDKEGSVTAANASGINDGGAAVVVMSETRARAEGRTPLARIRAYASAGVPPRVMGMGPVPAVRAALQRAGLTVHDIDLFELNEAFAAQSVAVGRELAVPDEKLNVNGGAIALGHPIGASGTRIMVTLLHEMQRRGAGLGVAGMCIGGGQGIAMVVERA
ncbi:MAG: acetyl-CoA C-acetyltransferase [Candidatus Dormibacteraeota bacterium]|uniref:acetyl-CoA C-acetyltransferase n=1 Tax=Candidatus Amunia macphersoniae TaxID=3127014 RepID=A0A934KFU6_9BACT|nr:acetyl-CoA C-acetyltransferase [Candidatus Dormibacteraeota bacterium]